MIAEKIRGLLDDMSGVSCNRDVLAACYRAFGEAGQINRDMKTADIDIFIRPYKESQDEYPSIVTFQENADYAILKLEEFKSVEELLGQVDEAHKPAAAKADELLRLLRGYRDAIPDNFPSTDFMAFGIGESVFREGYDMKTMVWNKSKCRITNPGRIDASKLRISVYDMAVLRQKEVVFQNENATKYEKPKDSYRYFDERALSFQSEASYWNAHRYGGNGLIIIIRRPEFMVKGVGYRLEEAGPDCTIKPGIVKVDKIMKIALQTFYNDTDKITRKLKLENITEGFW